MGHVQECVRTLLRLYGDQNKPSNPLRAAEPCAFQVAALAAEAGHDDETIVACLLQDIGWKLARQEPTSHCTTAADAFTGKRGSIADKLGILSFCAGGEVWAGEDQLRAQHDVIGATYLRMLGFNEKVPHLIEGHVLAKRYLCYREPSYYGTLSQASKRTLAFQGGPMTATEAAVFEKDPLYKVCIQMRMWDGKTAAGRVGSMDEHVERIAKCIVREACGAEETEGFYNRQGNTLTGLRLDDANKENICQRVLGLYADGSSYSPQLSQDAHGCQAAAMAMDGGYDDDTIVACLLHDIGWKLSRSEPTAADDRAAPEAVFRGREGSMADRLGILSFCGKGLEGAGEEQQRAQHDVIGATYLRMLGFREKVPHLVEGHVLAKRYLCYREADYYDKLSPASKRTLAFQGGAMSAEEAAVFERDPLFELCMQMRRWDEAAKVPGLKVPGFEAHVERMKRCIVRGPCSVGETRGVYVRDGNTLVGVNKSVVAKL